MATLTLIQQVRLTVQDSTVGLYILTDDEIQYFLDKNNNSIARSSIDAAKSILLNLSMRTDDTVDILSIKNSKVAEQYRLALQMFLKDPNTNPFLDNVKGYIGGVSISDMQANNATTDNNIITNPYTENCSKFPTSSYFEV
jgi:hypothetical protein